MNKIAVAPAFRRQGVASALMDEVFAFASRVDAEEMYLEVRVSNQRAQAFYAGLGFTETGRQSSLLLRRRGRARHGPEIRGAAPP